MNRNHRILIVDDNEAIHRDIRSILVGPEFLDDKETMALEMELFDDGGAIVPAVASGADSYGIDDAYQGEDAIEIVRRAANDHNPYSLVFMDVRMPPGLDGVETIKKIWEDCPDVQMVICTAYSDYSWDEIVANFGRTDKLLFLKKPFDTTALRQIVFAMTEKWQLEQTVQRLTGAAVTAEDGSPAQPASPE